MIGYTCPATNAVRRKGRNRRTEVVGEHVGELPSLCDGFVLVDDRLSAEGVILEFTAITASLVRAAEVV